QHWYATIEWKRLRARCLKAAGYTCQWAGCGRMESDTSLLVADHVVPHRGNRALFYDATNLQCLCKDCHDGPKQAQDRRLYGAAIDLVQGGDGVWR
ncbi:MAG: HNH endonuclease signature motif containing protein, partial [Deltaproteobacteria bacterium]